MKKQYRGLLYILPVALIFSYFPLIKLGENETMYFELSLSLLWLVVFDVVGLYMVISKYRKEIFTKVFGDILWWLFPLFATLSIAWSLNPLRGFLTVGVVWALFFAVLCFYHLRENLDEVFWKNFWRWFFGATLLVCAWCVVQCILDVVGVDQGATLLCDGCVYRMFGFPRATGFAIEPQFMGNLLLAPIFLSYYFGFKNKKYWVLFAIFAATLFLTFSRGAIYACVVGLCFLSTFMYFKAKKTERKKVCFSILKTIGIFVFSFVFTLNLQGIFAEVSPTNDTYLGGISKVLNQLSLGVIDVRGGEAGPVENFEKTEGKSEDAKNQVVENSDTKESNEASSSIYNGYVEESTGTRVRLFNAALTVWRSDFSTMMVGVGIGGAGQALYNNGLSPAPREIVQNEYGSILLETGIIGASLFVLLMIMVVKVFIKSPFSGVLLALLIAYGVSLFFFSGLTNALQIVLLPGLLALLTAEC